MTVKLTMAQATALARIEKSGDKPYIVPQKDKATFRALERDGYCQYRLFVEDGIGYNSYELTEKGRSFLSGRRV